MGMFDSLFIVCSSCGKRVEFQSKSGNCVLSEYNVGDVSPEIAGDLHGRSKQCGCGKTLAIETITMLRVIKR